MSDDDSSHPAAPVGPSAARTPRRRRLALWLASAVCAVAVLAAIAIGALVGAFHHAGASAWLLGFVPGLTVIEPKGSLIGDFAAKQVVYVVAGVGELRLDAPRWHALAAGRSTDGRWLHLTIDTLHADRAVWTAHQTKTSAGPATLPQSLRLPVEIEVREAGVDELRVGADDAMPIHDLHARVHLGADAGARHRLDALAARIEQGNARGAFTIGADAPFQVEATVDATSNTTAKDWSVAARASGPLEALDTTATVRAAATATHAAQSLDAHALIRPLAAWPLGALDASVRVLDLSAFASTLPATALTGEAHATTNGMDVPATISLILANARAGRWNEGLLPVRRLRAELRARPNQADVIEVQDLSAELGSAAAAAGTITGRGRWAPPGWNVDLEMRQVQPAALDARAASALVSGKATIAATGFGAAAATAEPPRIDLVADLAGQLSDRRLPDGAPRAARVRIEARASANEIELRRGEASLGDAAAKLDGRLVRASANQRWRASGRLELARFDPAPWWPGSADSLLARGANRLNAKGEFDLVPPTSGGESAYAVLAATTGTARLVIADSLLAGIALQGTVSYANSDGRARPSLDLVAAGNHVQLAGAMASRGASDDEWRIAVDAPRLDALAPLLAAPARTATGKHAATALSGSLVARARVAGRWPQVSSDGELQAKDLRF